MAADMSYLIFFLLLQIRHHLLTGYAHHVNAEIPCDGTLFHLFGLAKYAYDANPSILKSRIKGGSEHICKTVYDSVFGSILLKEWKSCMSFKCIMRWKEIIDNSELLLGTQLIVTLNSTNGEKQDTTKDACLQIYHRTWQLKDQTIFRH